MKKIIERIKKYVEETLYLVRFDVGTPELKKREIDVAAKISLGGAIVGIVMTILNIIVKSWVMALTTLFVSIVLIICRLMINRITNRMPLYIITEVSVGVLFSFYYIYGGNDGFAALWILLVPVALTAVFTNNSIIPASLYFLVFLILFSYTPLKKYVLFEYSESFVTRFPILYMAMLLFMARFGLKAKQAEVDKIKRTNELEEAVSAERKKNYENSVRTITTIVNAMEARDPYTRNHSGRVASYSKAIGEKLGFDKEKLNRLYLSGLVHDIGKINLPDVVLNKPQTLTKDEWEMVRQHPEMGYRIVWEYDSVVKGIGDATRFHHEHIDGTGYPYGLKGEKIPEFARIVAVADAFDAMTSKRVFKDENTLEYALGELTNGRGTQFDAQVVDIFVKMINDKEIRID